MYNVKLEFLCFRYVETVETRAVKKIQNFLDNMSFVIFLLHFLSNFEFEFYDFNKKEFKIRNDNQIWIDCESTEVHLAN